MIEFGLTWLLHLAHDPRAQNAASGFGGRIAGAVVTGAWRCWRARPRKQPERIIEGEDEPFRWSWQTSIAGRSLVLVGRGGEERPSP